MSSWDQVLAYEKEKKRKAQIQALKSQSGPDLGPYECGPNLSFWQPYIQLSQNVNSEHSISNTLFYVRMIELGSGDSWCDPHQPTQPGNIACVRYSFLISFLSLLQ